MFCTKDISVPGFSVCARKTSCGFAILSRLFFGKRGGKRKITGYPGKILDCVHIMDRAHEEGVI